MSFKGFYIKVGKLRLYDGTTPTPFFLEVPFRGPVTAPLERPRPAENLHLDRGRVTENSYYSQGPDDPILQGLPFSCNFLLANTEPNFSKFLTLIKIPGGTTTKTIGGHAWTSTKASSQVRNSDPEGTALVTTPSFADPEKFCVNVVLLWSDPDAANDRGFQWKEVYFPPDRQVTEGDNEVRVDLSGEIFGAISNVTAFPAGTES